VKDFVAADFFVVPTVFFDLAFVFVILSHDRRRVVHFGVTAYPTAEWAARQLWEAFPGTARRAMCYATGTEVTERNSIKRHNG